MVKRILPCLLALAIIFTSTLRPVYAAEVIEDTAERISFAYNFAGDSIVFTDVDGHIIEVRPDDSTAYNAAAGALLIQSSGGAMGAGAASILAPALPILGYLLAAGVVVYSVVGLANSVMDLYYLLSDAARAELDAIAESGADSFSLADNPNLAAELPQVYQETFYTDDGSFISAGITFDPTNMLEYNWSAQYIYGPDITSSAYKYALGATPAAIAGTSLSVAYVDSPFTGWSSAPTDLNKAFQITNAVTGATLTFALSSYYMDWLEYDCCDYSFTAPVVNTYTNSDGSVYHTLGFWVLSACSLVLTGETCEHHYSGYPYHSKYFGEATDTGSTVYYLFQNTGIAGLDDVIFDGQQYFSYDHIWRIYRAVAMDGVSYLTLPASGVETICSDLSYAQALTDVANPPAEDDKIYLPPAVALSNANTLTQTGALTGNYSEVVTGNPSVPGTETDTSGFWATLWNWLTSILDAILGIPGLIVDGITGVLEYLFVPDLTAMGEVVDVYSSKFGWVSDIYYFISNVFDRLTWDVPPKIPINLSAAESKYDWGTEGYVLDMSWYARYKDSVDSIISGIVWLFFLWRMFRRLPDILSGVGMVEEYSTLEKGWVWTERKEKADRKAASASRASRRKGG